MKISAFFIVLLFLNICVLSQTESDKQEAYDLAKKAIELMDNGDIDQSIEFLEKSRKLDPKNHIYPYELGYAFYIKKDFDKASKLFEQVVKMDGINDQSYQMLGNAYSMSGNREKAIKSYKKGLKIYPNSGKLYLELGNVHQDDWNEALQYYEQGANVDPAYSSNYYWLTKIFCNSSEEIWGMLYGEMFMNLERGSKRTEEISKLLFDIYAREIQFPTDTSVTVSFCQNQIITIDQLKKALPFSMVYEPTLLLSISDARLINLESLNKIRTEFIGNYYHSKFDKSHPNVIFDWNKTLVDNGYFESYNYWMLMQGAPDEFDLWYTSNQESFDEFINWFAENPMEVNEKMRFHRSDY